MSDQIKVPDLIRMHRQGEKITMLTAYDYTFARLLDEGGVDVILVGDSLGAVMQGGENTLSVTLDEVIYHAKIVARGVTRALLVGDMPFMSYQTGWRTALRSAGRMIKESGVSAVKLEGGDGYEESIFRLVRSGIPVMGHLGLTPQSINVFGGYRVQGRTEQDRLRLLEEAKAVEAAGAFALVLEAIPSDLGKEITEALSIPTIGIGAGPNCSGQVLVMHDLLGLSFFPGQKKPKFVKAYRNLAGEVKAAVAEYCDEVKDSQFPDDEHSYEHRATLEERVARERH